MSAWNRLGPRGLSGSYERVGCLPCAHLSPLKLPVETIPGKINSCPRSRASLGMGGSIVFMWGDWQWPSTNCSGIFRAAVASLRASGCLLLPHSLDCVVKNVTQSFLYIKTQANRILLYTPKSKCIYTVFVQLVLNPPPPLPGPL